MSYEQMKTELNVIYLLKTINKLKAGLSAIVRNDKNLIKRAKMLYINNSVVSMDKKELK